MKAALIMEIRAAKREDNAPIKLKNNAYTRMYEVLTKMYGMPNMPVRPDTNTCAILLALLCFLYGRCGLRSGY